MYTTNAIKHKFEHFRVIKLSKIKQGIQIFKFQFNQMINIIAKALKCKLRTDIKLKGLNTERVRN